MKKYEVKIKLNAYHDKRELSFIVEAENESDAKYFAANIEAAKLYDVFCYQVINCVELIA